MQKSILTGLGIVVVLAGGFFLFGMNDGSHDGLPASIGSTPTPPPTNKTSPTPTPASTASVQAFTVVGSNFEFSQAEIRVKEGDRVRITFENSSGQHDWRLDEFDVATKILRSGESETIEFTAHRAGTFEYYCSVGKHREMGMKGSLIVEP